MTLEELQEAILEVQKKGNPSWRMKTSKGHRIRLVLDSGATRTIFPKDAIPGMKVQKGKSTGGSFRVANGQEIPNLGEARISGRGRTYGDQVYYYGERWSWLNGKSQSDNEQLLSKCPENVEPSYDNKIIQL